MKRLRLPSIVLLLAMVGMMGCTKEGPTGPQGEAGQPGQPGPRGSQGIAGAGGSAVYSGKGNPTVDLGQPGDYYLDITASELYGPKTKGGWEDPISLKGEKGDRGETGPKGPKGDKGEKGSTGPKGSKGERGEAGQDGADASRIWTGADAPAATMGKAGDYYLDTDGFILYGPKTANVWGSGIALRGPKGDKGTVANANVTSSGWFTIPEAGWTDTVRGQMDIFAAPDDLSVAIAYPAPFKIDAADAGGLILVYVDNGKGIRLTPFRTRIQSVVTEGNDVLGHYDGAVEFRFVMKALSEGQYAIVPVVSLKQGDWDWILPEIPGFPYPFFTEYYIQKDYLPALKWKVVVIPANASARHASPPPDASDYQATCAYYGLPE